MQYSLIQSNGSHRNIELADSIFGSKFNEALVHQVVCAYSANKRQGTHSQKTKAEVSGGGKKPWRQKGTGRARAGSIRSPLWRGGGATFAVKPRDYSQKVNKKMYRNAMRSILSELVRSDRLIVMETISVNEPKTRIIAKHLKMLDAQHVMIILDSMNETFYLAARNLPDVKLCFSGNINPMDLVKYRKTIIVFSALKKLEENLL